jgi:hypothetical protein
VTTVERSLQAAEILQAVGQKRDEDRAQWMKAAGLKEIERITVRRNKLRCTMSIMVPLDAQDGPAAVQEGAELVAGDGDKNSKAISKRKRKLERARKEEPHRFSAGELVVGIIDDCTASKDTLGACTAVKHLLHTMSQGADFIPLNSVGLVKEEVTVQPTLLAIATEALGALSDYILPLSVSVPLPDPSEGLLDRDEPELAHLAAKTDDAAAAALSPEAGPSVSLNAMAASAAAAEVPQVTRAGTVVPLKLSIVGELTLHGSLHLKLTVASQEIMTPRYSFACLNHSLSINLTHFPSGHSAGGAVGAYMAMILEVTKLYFVLFIEINRVRERYLSVQCAQ